jgi:hypothetical protein
MNVMSIHRRVAFVVVLALVAGACGDGGGATTTAPDTTTTTAGPATPQEVVVTSDFENGSDGWASDVSDFTDQTRPEDLLSETGAVPPGLDDAGSGFFHVTATNRSDDLFLYLRRPVTADEGIVPDTAYRLRFTLAFATDAPSGCAGVGGAPGESVWMKVGGATEEPVPVAEDGDVRLSVDKGNQSGGGLSAEVAGVIANGIPCEDALAAPAAPYAMVTLDHTFSGTVTSDGDGRLWLLVGTDSGFEGRTSVYYDRIDVVLTPAEG